MKKLVSLIIALGLVGISYLKVESGLSSRWLIKKTGSDWLGDGALSVTTSFNKDWLLLEVNLHFRGAVNDTVELVRDNTKGADYDTLLKSETLSSATNFVYVAISEGLNVFPKGDELLIRTKSTQSTTVYYTIIGCEIAP